jgi:hypothetical protein
VLSVFIGTLAAFASFALIAMGAQGIAGGKPADPTSKERLAKSTSAVAAQMELLDKYGLKANPEAVFEKAAAQIQSRKESVTAQAVPGTPTALQQAAAAAPAPTAAPAPAAAPALAPAPPTNPK